MKKLTVLFLTLALCGTMLAGCGSSKSDSAAETDTSETAETAGADTSADNASDKKEGSDENASAKEELLTGLHHITIDVQDYGTITLELDADEAHISVTNFVNLAKECFYDGLTFHRIISGFMIQGGDPKGNGTGGSDTTIKGEFSENGVENNIFHVRGAISMARANDPDSASSQFFIVHEDSTFLDGQYAAFGHVTDGMDVVDAICENTPVQDNHGTVKAADQPVITSITVID